MRPGWLLTVAFIGGVGAARKDFDDGNNGLGNDALKNEIRSLMKLPLRSAGKVSQVVSMAETRRHEPSAPGSERAFTDDQCAAFEKSAEALVKKAKHNSNELCRGFHLIDPTVAGVDLSRMRKPVTRQDQASLADTYKAYTNDRLVGLVRSVLEDNFINVTNNGKGQRRHYADVIKALIESDIKVYLIGGFVRDFARGLPANDVDIGFSKSPWDVVQAISDKLGVWKSTSLTGLGSDGLIVVPEAMGGGYFKYGGKGTQIEGKPDSTNVYASFLQTDFSMNTLGMNMGCLGDPSKSCYVLDKTGVGVEHALSGVFDLPYPGGSQHASIGDFNDWLSFGCDQSLSPCMAAMRYLKFAARGFRPTPKFRDWITYSLRVLLVMADTKGASSKWSDFHSWRKKAHLAPLFTKGRGKAPDFEIVDEVDLHVDGRAALLTFFEHARAKGEKEKIEVLKLGTTAGRILEAQISEDASHMCEQTPGFCLTEEEVFASVFSWSTSRRTRVQQPREHPCGGDYSPRATGWYLWKVPTFNMFKASRWEAAADSKFEMWHQNNGRAIDQGVLGNRDNMCKVLGQGHTEEKPQAFDISTLRSGDSASDRPVCYVPTGSTDPVLDALARCG